MKQEKKGKWIFIPNKLMTEVAPPAMSIHYAVPWPMELPEAWKKNMRSQARELRRVLADSELVDTELLDETKDEDLWDFLENDEVYDYVSDYDDSLLDKVTDKGFNFWDISREVERQLGAMQIKFAGENIRIFPEEYSDISLDHMKEYVQVYKFHPTDLWNGLGAKPTDPDERFIYEAALLDGCDEFQATNIVNGGDIESVDDFPAPLGWYECPLEYGLYFGRTEEDMQPTLKKGVCT